MADARAACVVWHRFGKEHDESGFRVNDPDVVEAHIREKVERFKATPEDVWRWHQVSDDLIIERPDEASQGFRPDSAIYYIPSKMLCLQENMHQGVFGENWPWYVHIGEMVYRKDLEAWVFKDLFADVIAHQDGRTYRVLDLDDLGDVMDLGLLENPLVSEILRSTQELIDQIQAGAFPPAELANRNEVRATLGWSL